MSPPSAALRNLAAWTGAAAAACASATLWLASRPGGPLSALGHGGYDSAFLALVALVPMMVWLEVAPQRVGALAGGLAALGMGAGMAFLSAYGSALSVLPALGALGYGAEDADATARVAATMQAVPVAIATTLTWLAVRRGRRAPGFFVFAWVAAEGLLPLGSERLAVALYEHPQWIALASLGGPSLVSLQLALVNGAVAECLLLAVPPRRRPYLVLAAAVAMGGSLGIHAIRTEALGLASANAPTVDVLMVQSGTPGDAALATQTTSALAALGEESVPDVVVWPASGFEPPLEWSDVDLSSRLPADVALPFVVGTALVRGTPPEGPSVNALLLTDAEHQRQFLYQATVMAPFIDSTPLAEALPESVRAHIHDAGRRPGQHGAMFDLARVPFGVMVGWDDISGPDLRRQLDEQDPEWLLSVVDDRAFVGTPLPEYHHACAVFRAIEHGRFTLRVAAQGGSALIDPLGAIRSRSAQGEPLAEVVAVPRMHAETGYRAVGNFATLLCLVFALSLVLLRPARPPGPEGEGDTSPEAA